VNKKIWILLPVLGELGFDMFIFILSVELKSEYSTVTPAKC